MRGGQGGAGVVVEGRGVDLSFVARDTEGQGDEGFGSGTCGSAQPHAGPSGPKGLWIWEKPVWEPAASQQEKERGEGE